MTLTTLACYKRWSILGLGNNGTMPMPVPVSTVWLNMDMIDALDIALDMRFYHDVTSNTELGSKGLLCNFLT